MNQSVKKTFQILEYIASNGNFVRLNDVAKALDLKKNSVHSFLDSLKQLGYLEQDDVSPRYRITSKLECLYAPIFSVNELKNELRPILEKITNLTNESSYLAVQMGAYYRNELKCEPNRAVKITLGMGKDYEMTTTAIGKSFLAFSEHLKNNLSKQYNEAELLAIENETKSIIKSGYALDVQAYDPDLNCVAMPIFYKNKPIAVLCVSGPSFRFKEPQFMESLKIMERLIQEHGKYDSKLNMVI
jgi:IclR family KDG regulon transcriptional repressor